MRTALVVLAACGGGSGGGTGDHTVDGSVVEVGGGSAPAEGNTFVFWVSDLGQGDFAYKWGEGTATATSFDVDVDVPVPDDATFGGLLGVGQVALVNTSVNTPDGVIDSATLETEVVGFAGRYALIFRPDATPVPDAPWLDAFPVGLSCGVCVQQPSGFDTFLPVSCDDMELEVGPAASVFACNWT